MYDERPTPVAKRSRATSGARATLEKREQDHFLLSCLPRSASCWR